MAPKRLIAQLPSSGPLTLDMPRVLKKALSPATSALLFSIGEEAQRQNVRLYVVGGFVRDLLLGRPTLDLDLVVEGDAIQLGQTLLKRFGGHLVPHKSFGTAVWWLPDAKSKMLSHLGVSNAKKPAQELPVFVDLVSARQEGYRRPGALPDVKFADIHADQSRRDFSINTLALRLDGLQAGQILDPWDGLKDLHSGTLRVLHSQSFSDDPTRILRIVRLAVRLKFEIEPATLKQLKVFLHLMSYLSGDRIRRELEFVLGEEQHAQILASMQKLGLLRSIHHGLKWQAKMANLVRRPIRADSLRVWGLENVSLTDLRFILWFLHLPPHDVSLISDRLRFTADLRAAVTGATRLSATMSSLRSLPPSRLVSALEREPLASVFALYLLNRSNKFGEKLQRYAKEWRHVRARVDGDDLKKMGLKPGPDYRNILDRLRTAWLDGEVKNAKQEKALLKKVIDG